MEEIPVEENKVEPTARPRGRPKKVIPQEIKLTLEQLQELNLIKKIPKRVLSKVKPETTETGDVIIAKIDQKPRSEKQREASIKVQP